LSRARAVTHWSRASTQKFRRSAHGTITCSFLHQRRGKRLFAPKRG